jgi:hypothetical protein
MKSAVTPEWETRPEYGSDQNAMGTVTYLSTRTCAAGALAKIVARAAAAHNLCQKVIRPTNWMFLGCETVPFQTPKLGLDGSLLNGMQSPNA